MKKVLIALLLFSTTAFAQGTKQDGMVLKVGSGLGGVNVAVCNPVATTSASITSNLAILTMASNPTTAGYITGKSITVAGFSGSDTYFNGTYTILVVNSTQIMFALSHANATSATNGTVLQQGDSTTPCAGLVTIYSDPLLSVPQANPFQTDGYGNYGFWGTPGNYWVQLYGPQVTTTLSEITVTCGPSGTGCSGGGGGGVSLTTDNTWTNNNRFKGPIPFRDVTAFMPDGGCSFNAPQFATYTGSMSSSSATLTLSSAGDFKNGCGITVEHAGAGSSLVMPSCPSLSSAIRTSNVVTIVCSAPTNLVWTGTGGANGQDQGVNVTGCSDATFNGNWVMSSNDASSTFTYTSAGSNGSPTGCAVTFLLGWAHGITGATTYYYKIASVDSGSGMAKSLGPLTITNGNASLSTSNYNAIYWPFVVNSKGTVIYRSTDGVNYSCVGLQMVGIAYQDWGYSGPCPTYVSSTPPTLQTAQDLTTTIVSGAGTTTLTLGATATTPVSSQPVYHDEMPFLDACVNAVNTDQKNLYGYNQGSAGCYLPAGVYHFASDWTMDRIDATGGGVSIVVAGTIFGHEWPISIGKNNYQLKGVGWSGGSSNAALNSSVQIVRDINQPAGIVLKGESVFEGFNSSFNNGHSMMVGLNPDGRGGAAGVHVSNVLLGNSGTSAGVPLYIGGNTFQLYFDNVNFGPRPDGFPASVLMTTDSFLGIGGSDIYFDRDQFIWHHFFTNAPGGQSGQGFNFTVDHMWSEEHGQYPTGGFITVDTGQGTIPGTSIAPSSRLAALALANMQNADAANKTFLEVLGTNATNGLFVGLNAVDEFNPMVYCPSVSGSQSSCAQGGVAPNIISDSAQFLSGLQKNYTGPSSNGTYVVGSPMVTAVGNGNFGQTPASPWFADAIPPPNTLQVTGTGSGSLAAGTYCMRIVGLDAQSTPGSTLPGPEVCQAVGSSSSITLVWQVPQFNGWNYANFQLWYGTSSGNETNYITTGIGPQAGSVFGITFTSTAGAVSGTLPTSPTAYLSWLYRDNNAGSCIYCSAGNTSGYKLGIGATSPTEKLDVNGSINASALLKWKASTAFQGILSHTNTANRTYTFLDQTGTIGNFASVAGWTPGNCIKADTVAGSLAMDSSTCGGGAGGMNTSASNAAATAVSASWIPGAVNTYALGSAALPWTQVFLGTVANQAGSFDTSSLTANRSVKLTNGGSMVVPQACVAVGSQFMTAINATTGACTLAQPAIGDISGITFSGNTTELGTVTGAVTSGHVATWDASGNLQDGGTAVSNSSTNTFTNKTLDQEGTGNVVTVVSPIWIPAAGANGASAGPTFNLPVSSAPNPQVLTGTNIIAGVLDYDDATAETAQTAVRLPHTWVGNIDVSLVWLVSAGGGANAVKWTIATACSADGSSFDTVYNAAQTVTTSVAANGIQTVSTQSTVTTTGCAVDNLMNFKIGRDITDTSNATARLLGMKVTVRHTGS